jgi:RNA polymerase sigma-70 factor (ECF subfamily)
MQPQSQDLPALLAADLDSHFGHFMGAYQQRLRAFALRYSGNAQDAEDIVQETFLRVHHALKNYPATRIRTLHMQQWLYKVALNVCRNHARRAEPQAAPLDASEESPLLEIEDQSGGPDEEVDRREERRELERWIATLPEPYRSAVNLHYFEDLSLREVAELLNQPVGTVKANVHRGLQLLRKTLQAQANEWR